MDGAEFLSPSPHRHRIKSYTHLLVCLFHSGKSITSKAMYGPGFAHHPMKGTLLQCSTSTNQDVLRTARPQPEVC